MQLNSLRFQEWFTLVGINFYLVLISLIGMNVHADATEVKDEKLEPSLYFQEKISTIETYITEGTGVGMGGESVLQPHRSVIHSATTSGIIAEDSNSPPAVVVIAVGRHHTTSATVAGKAINQRNEIRTTFAISSPQSPLHLFLDGAEILEQPGGEYQLQIRIAFRNSTDKTFRITPKSFKYGHFLNTETQMPESTLQIGPASSGLGTLLYDLAKLNAGYTLQIPTNTPFNSH